MSNTDYAQQYRGIDFRQQPERYRIGRGEQGVLIAEPYKSELLPLWTFKTEAAARASARAIYAQFERYAQQGDFVGMDMARKFLQMGFTRARRYANHPSGKKYADDGETVRPQAADAQTSEKARAADVFYEYYRAAKNDPQYVTWYRQHKKQYG